MSQNAWTVLVLRQEEEGSRIWLSEASFQKELTGG